MAATIEEVTHEALTLSDEERARLAHTLLESLPMARTLSQDEEALARRRELTQKFVAGVWGVDLSGYERARTIDRREAHARIGHD